MVTGSGTDGGPSSAPLSDLMIAMDVVDTLRHDRALVERELNDETRRTDLIERLREIYRGQGIEVPDHILEDGVKALEDERFTYKPAPVDHLSTKIAKLYVTRGKWGRYVGGATLAAALLWGVDHFAYQRPKLAKQAAEKAELQQRLPARLAKIGSDIASEARSKAVAERAQALVRQGLNAASSEDLPAARTAERSLQDLLAQLRTVYEVRIVNRRGEVSGLWRVPRQRSDNFNYYIVVEAVSPMGDVLPQWITNEETSRRELVRTWAIRVDKSVFERVKADKADDQIIQNIVAGRKERGELEPTWNIPTLGGAITKWN